MRFLRKLLTLISVYYAYMLEYRAEIVLWMLSGILPFILMGVWMRASSQYSYGLTPVEFARYYLSVFLTHQFVVVWVIWEFEEDFITGQLSPYLLQPFDPLWRYLSAHIAERFSRLPFLIFMILAFFLLYPDALWIPSFKDLILYVIAVHLAFMVRFFIQYTLSLFVFWTERVLAFEELNRLIFLFFSGYIAPLELFPNTVKNLVMWTPYPYIVSFPVNILLGKERDVLSGMLVLLLWLMAILAVNRIVWKMGISKYSAMGA